MDENSDKPFQFGLGSLFALTACAAAVSALPSGLMLFVLLTIGYLACASGWIIDLAIVIGRWIIRTAK